MDGKVWIMSVTCSWIFCTVLAAPAAEAAAVGPLRHVRHKRCSCASFLDKECVYFCHLDIIWVNTPERLVSYGLGNAPRARRALTDSAPAGRGARCRCARDPDRTCEKFCLRLDTATESKQRHETNRTEEVNNDLALPPALQVTTRTRALLEKWAKARRRHRARAWRGESRAS